MTTKILHPSDQEAEKESDAAEIQVDNIISNSVFPFNNSQFTE